MLSIDGPYSLPPLSEIFRSLSSHQISLVKLRFKVDSVDYEIFTGFGPAFLEGIFQRFPALEELCLDQEVHLKWPMYWVSRLVK
jgi:hypothetical protein